MTNDRQILLARDSFDALASMQPRSALRGMTVVTMRSLSRARGMSAAAVWSTREAREHPAYDRAIEVVLPCVLGRTEEPEISARLALAAQSAGLERVA